jgi:hypothetical protein
MIMTSTPSQEQANEMVRQRMRSGDEMQVPQIIVSLAPPEGRDTTERLYFSYSSDCPPSNPREDFTVKEHRLTTISQHFRRLVEVFIHEFIYYSHEDSIFWLYDWRNGLEENRVSLPIECGCLLRKTLFVAEKKFDWRILYSLHRDPQPMTISKTFRFGKETT